MFGLEIFFKDIQLLSVDIIRGTELDISELIQVSYMYCH